jgi:anti-sigma-K factor RskA
MNDGSLHELSAAYALDALDGDDLRAFESHLATCERCRNDVAGFRETAAALAYDVQPRAVPETLERRILTAARAERPAATPPRGRWAVPAAGIAAIAAGVAVGLGIWAIHLSSSLDRERAARSRDARVVAILEQPGAREIATRGAGGLLVVAPSGEAVLVARGLPPAARGKTYEAWVVRGQTALPAGLFRGGAGNKVLRLTQPVPRGALVGVTLESSGGSKTPHGAMLVRAST